MKKTMLCAAVLALSVAATGCASGKKAESSAASTEAARLRAMLRDHRGLNIERRIKAAFWWCYMHSPQSI